MIDESNSVACSSFLAAAQYQGPVGGATHTLYKYPARLSPVFARSAVATFTRPGGVVLDPFVGGGTTMIEARLAGRHAFGSDISSLAVFLTRTKITPLSRADLQCVQQWFDSISERLNIHRPVENLREGRFAGYDRNMPWRLRKLCEQYLASLVDLPTRSHQRFARCVLLRCGQWAMDCRKRIPSVSEFRTVLAETLEKSGQAMHEYRHTLLQAMRVTNDKPVFQCVQSSASELRSTAFAQFPSSGADLILTSPPYPGVHVLYHRWNVRARRETPAPFWLADCLDGHGSVYYTFGDRRKDELPDYFGGIENAFANLHQMLADNGLIVQMVAFSSEEWQLDAYLAAMRNAGYREMLPKEVGVRCKGRLWRPVPGRRWYSMIRGAIPSSREVVLFHRKA
jgi:hypothetical protein